MKNYLQHGETLSLAAPSGGVVGGLPYLIGALFGVATHDAAEAALFEFRLKGVFSDLAKVTGTAWVAGDVLYWDNSAKKLTKVAASNRAVAIAALDAASGDTVGSALLVPDLETVGQVAGVAAGYKVARGQHTTLDADDTVVTGLATVVSAVASLDDDPVAGAQAVSATIGDQAGSPAAGSIQIKTWKATAAGDTALIPATTFTKLVNWIAIGT